MAKPGVMFYFDIRPCLKRLSIEEKGLLFEAILDYAEYGTEPNLESVAGVAWDFIKPGIDRDSDRYECQVLQKRYAAYTREAKKNGLTPVYFDDWKSLSDDEKHRLISADIGRYPTTTPTPTTTIESMADKPSARSRFSPPTVDEVKSYCTEKGYAVDPDRFVDFYTSNGWRVGKNPMKDWKAAVRTWNGKDKLKANSINPMPSYGGDENWSL